MGETDLISRQAAIDAVENIDCSDGVGISALKCEAVDDGVTAIKALPSAQPEKVDTPTVDTPNCDDTISRQAAIDALDKHLQTTDVPVSYPGIISALTEWLNEVPSAQPETHEERTETHACDLISRQAVIEINRSYHGQMPNEVNHRIWKEINELPSAQPDTEKICARIKAEAIKRNVEYMKHGDRYMLGFVDGMRLARRIVDGTIDDPVYFTLSGE